LIPPVFFRKNLKKKMFCKEKTEKHKMKMPKNTKRKCRKTQNENAEKHKKGY